MTSEKDYLDSGYGTLSEDNLNAEKTPVSVDNTNNEIGHRSERQINRIIGSITSTPKNTTRASTDPVDFNNVTNLSDISCNGSRHYFLRSATKGRVLQ